MYMQLKTKRWRQVHACSWESELRKEERDYRARIQLACLHFYDTVSAKLLSLGLCCHRFWYEREGQFSADQLQQLRKTSLARIICDNADNITTVPRDVFVLQPVSQFVKCSDISTVNLTLWKDCSGNKICNGIKEYILERKTKTTETRISCLLGFADKVCVSQVKSVGLLVQEKGGLLFCFGLKKTYNNLLNGSTIWRSW